jgi:hypothetical protein
MQKLVAISALSLVIVASGGCREENTEPLTNGEARLALEEAAMSTQASNLTSSSVELTTDFTIGGAVEAAAEEIRDYVVSQLPCAEINLEGNTLDIEYGALPGNCEYRGHTYSGGHTITVSRNEMNEVVVEHVWDELSNGDVTVDGGATVTWNFDDETRHVVHDLEWTRERDGRTGIGRGDRIQQPLSGGISEGIQVDGDRSWDGQKGHWALDINAVQMRWSDPVPQSGKYELTTPENKKVTLTFERVDEDTIAVNLANGNRDFTFNVSKHGAIDG